MVPLNTRTLFALLALLPTAAPAADADATSAGAVEESLADDLVVTATRGPASAFTAPVSISRIDGEDFASIGARHQADLLNQTPGVYVQRGSGAESLVAIRSPVLAGASACGAFLVAEDSMPIRPVGFCNLNEMFEVNYEQAHMLEVLRGPASALFGASAVHGIVNVITPDTADMPELFLSAATGSDSFKRVAFGWAPQAPGNIAAYGVATRAPGWRDASGVDELKLNLLADEPVGEGRLKIRAAGTVLNQETAGFIQGFDSYRDERLARSNPNPEAFRDASSARISVQYASAAPLGASDRYEIGGIYRRSRMDFSQHFLIGKPVEHNAQTSFMLSGARFFQRGAWSARLALDVETADTELTEFQSGPATDGAPAANAIRPAGLHYDYSVAARTVGGTASVEYDLTDHWRATAALRADSTNYDYDNHMLAGNTRQDGSTCGVSGCLYARPADRSDRFGNVSPRLSLAWNDLDNHYYLGVSSGYRPPEMTELYRLQRQQTRADLDSEQLQSAELGWKAHRGPFEWELALFAMEKRHVILRESNGFNVGDGATRHRGVEYRLACSDCGPEGRAFRITVSGTVARHEYAFSRAIEGGETITRGNDIDTAPRHVHSVELAYPASPAAPWRAALNWNYLGSYYLDAANSARYPGHQWTGLRLSWRGSDALSLTLRVDNLFDTAHADRADFAFGNYRYFPGRGRAAFLSLDYTLR